MTELRVDKLSVKVGEKTLVDKASFEFRAGELIALIGPNGAGKTSLLRGALALEKTTSGQSSISGEATDRLSPSMRARAISYLPQTRPLAWPIRVRDLVALGRFAYGAESGRLSETDHAAVDHALEQCGLMALAERRADTLSGGELARVHCARAFAAQAPLIIADEPVAALDLKYQFAILDLFRGFVRAGGGALLVLHDLRLAARYADRLIVMDRGRILADGPTRTVLTAQMLRDVFSVQVKIEGGQIHDLDPL